jgi:hypothetical protein
MINYILKAAKTQPVISFSREPQNGCNLLQKLVQKMVGETIRLHPKSVELFERLFIIYNREREWPENLYLDHIKSNLIEDPEKFPSYRVNRCEMTWPTRDDLMRFISKLRHERKIHDLLSNSESSEEGLELAQIEFSTWLSSINSFSDHVTGIPWLLVFTTEWVQTRIIETLARLYSKENNKLEIITIYNSLLEQRLYFQRIYFYLLQLLFTHKKGIEVIGTMNLQKF